MMKVEEITFDSWENIFNKSGSSNYFQSPEWLRLQSSTFNLKNLFYKIDVLDKSKYISFQEKEGNIYSSFIGYGGFLTRDGEIENLGLIHQTLNTISGKYNFKVGRVKLNPFLNYIGIQHPFIKSDTVILKMEDSLEKQEQKFNKKTRNLVRKSIKNGLIVKKISLDEVDLFYRFYKTTMERVGSNYLTSIDLFKKFTETDNVDFLGAYLKNKLVAGSIFLTCNDAMYYWWNSSSQEGRLFGANYILIFNAIKNAIKRNINFLDMASSHSKSIEEPKLKWGAERVPYYILEG